MGRKQGVSVTGVRDDSHDFCLVGSGRGEGGLGVRTTHPRTLSRRGSWW